jgi:hypothetical protein
LYVHSPLPGILGYMYTCAHLFLPDTRRQPLHMGNGCHGPPVQFGVGSSATCFSRAARNLVFVITNRGYSYGSPTMCCWWRMRFPSHEVCLLAFLAPSQFAHSLSSARLGRLVEEGKGQAVSRQETRCLPGRSTLEAPYLGVKKIRPRSKCSGSLAVRNAFCNDLRTVSGVRYECLLVQRSGYATPNFERETEEGASVS